MNSLYNLRSTDPTRYTRVIWGYPCLHFSDLSLNLFDILQHETKIILFIQILDI
jgi:hypothetical protein